MLQMYLMLLETEEERDKFNKIYNDNVYQLIYFAKSKLKNQQDAEDAVEEVFLRVAKNFQKISGNVCENWAGYLVIAVRNQCIDVYRKRTREAKRHIPLTEETEDLVYAHAYDDVLNMERISDRARTAAEYVSKLPPKLRAVMELRLNTEMGNGEIALALGIKESTASMRYKRAREAIENMIKAEQEGVES